MEKQDLEKQINETLMLMAQEPKNLENYHKLSRL